MMKSTKARIEKCNFFVFVFDFVCVGCVMLDSLKVLIDLCNECWASDSQTRWF
jgi:hypothetical protein